MSEKVSFKNLLKIIFLLNCILLLLPMVASAQILTIGSNQQNMVASVAFGDTSDIMYYLAKINSDSFSIYREEVSTGDTQVIYNGDFGHIENATLLTSQHYDGTDTYILFAGHDAARQIPYTCRVNIDGSDSGKPISAVRIPVLKGYPGVFWTDCFPGSDSFFFVGSLYSSLSSLCMLVERKEDASRGYIIGTAKLSRPAGVGMRGDWTYILAQPRISPDGDKLAFVRMRWETPAPYWDTRFNFSMCSLKEADVYVLYGVNDILSNNVGANRLKSWDDPRLHCLTLETTNFCFMPSWGPTVLSIGAKT